MTGTVISNVLKAVAGLILAKQLGDALYGVFATYSATYSILCIVATARYELAIMLPKEDNDGFQLMLLSSGMSVAFSTVLAIGMLLFGWIFSVELNWFGFIPITLSILGVYSSVNYWLNRTKQYKKLSINRILQGILFCGYSFSFSVIEPLRANSLILGYIFSQATALVIYIIYATIDYKKLKIKVSLKRMKELAFENINFPKLSVASGVINTLAVKLPVYLLGFFFGDKVVGQYGLMENILAAPISIISEAIRDVFRQKASKDYADDHECYHTYKTTFRTLALTAIVPFALIMFGGKPILNLFCQDKYLMTGTFILIMAPFYYIKFIVSPLTFMTYIANKQSFDMKWQIMFCIASASGFFLGYIIFHNPYGMLFLYGIALAIMYGISFNYTRRLAKGEL